MRIAERKQSEEDIKAFFKQWNVYQKVISMNYMMHREMFDFLLDTLKYRSGQPVSILDVGCGDAAIIARALKGMQVEAYCGIDLSAAALACAADNLKDIKCEKKLIEADFGEAVNQIDRTYSFIIAGFSLHHLKKHEKETFFESAASLLDDEGYIVIYDLIRNNNESRDDYINRLCETYQKEWLAMSGQEMEDIYDHIRQNDYPEKMVFYDHLAEKYGFPKYQLKFRDEADLYGFYTFSGN